jgi:hypothetical protein
VGGPRPLLLFLGGLLTGLRAGVASGATVEGNTFIGAAWAMLWFTLRGISEDGIVVV